jgi:hypothetical protein
VYWILPVKMETGVTSYERIVLYVRNSGHGVLVKGISRGSGLNNLGGNLNAANEADRALINNRTFLVAFANRLIDAQAFRTEITHVGSNGIST